MNYEVLVCLENIQTSRYQQGQTIECLELKDTKASSILVEFTILLLVVKTWGHRLGKEGDHLKHLEYKTNWSTLAPWRQNTLEHLGDKTPCRTLAPWRQDTLTPWRQNTLAPWRQNTLTSPLTLIACRAQSVTLISSHNLSKYFQTYPRQRQMILESTKADKILIEISFLQTINYVAFHRFVS